METEINLPFITANAERTPESGKKLTYGQAPKEWWKTIIQLSGRVRCSSALKMAG